jgi:hypothetical protein
VATVRLLELEINLYKLEIEVVAITPFIFVVSTELFSVKFKVFELIIDEVEVSPFTIEVKVLIAEFSEFWFMNLAVAVDITPLIFEANSKELVEVEIVSLLLPIIVEVETEPPMLEVRTFPIRERIFETDKLVTETLSANKLVDVELEEVELVEIKFNVVKLVKKADMADKTFEKRFVEVELVFVELADNKFPKVGLSLKVNVTWPLLFVATDKLLDAAMNLYKLEIEVVDIAPFIVVVIKELFSSKFRLLELMIDEVEVSPFTIEVKVFMTEFKEF